MARENLKHGGASGQRDWVWENFTSGNNVAFMDPYLVVWPGRNAPEGTTADPRIGVKPDNLYAPIRDAMGMTLTYANRMNLVAMTPQPSLCSTHFCLVDPGQGIPGISALRRTLTVNLRAGTYQYEWLDPSSNLITSSGALSVTDGNHTFSPAYSRDAVLYLYSRPSR